MELIENSMTENNIHLTFRHNFKVENGIFMTNLKTPLNTIQLKTCHYIGHNYL